MAKRIVFITSLIVWLLWSGAARSAAQQDDGQTRLRVVVNLVQLNVAVTDRRGSYVTDLRPEDFIITEDGIPEAIATFEEGNGPTRKLVEVAEEEAAAKQPEGLEKTPTNGDGGGIEHAKNLNAALAGADVFVLFDTSNYMYRGFVFAQDAISDFIRSLETVDKVAFYSYSRDLCRAAALTPDRTRVIQGVRTTVAGDDAALYTGRKVIVVFSNGPDNASMVPPEDVAELAQSAGIPIYMISTSEARLEPVSTAVFERMSAATGGKAYFARSWRDEKQAFESIRDDLGHLYSLTYYPKPNPNRGWRAIRVTLTGDRAKKCHIRTRNGYRPAPSRFSAGTGTAAINEAPVSGSSSQKSPE
jgi:Ca-activated chloride channel homolog